MAGIIKNQILKHLSKFAKNLSSNSINVSTLRGEGELHNLELNEKVLTELLELPNWMLISQASVNKVSLKIQWTKLKSTPIFLTLDEVYVQMETCSELRPHGVPSELGAYKSGSKYGFVEKVIDGMTVSINSVYVKFNSLSFTTSFHLSRITLCSKSPSWQLTDLRMTRLKDLNQQHILIFKELSWHTLKIESRSTDSQRTPIRLITNQSCCRITVKKKLSDCSVVGCRLVLLMEDILWVLTDSQILSAYYLVESLSGLIKKATEQSQKAKAARKLESIPSYLSNPLHSYGTSTHGKGPAEKEKSTLWNSGYSPAHSHIDQSSMHKFQVFKRFDVVETSYHFFSEKIDLHFCDDPGPGRSSYPDLNKGGTLQLNVMKIKLDYYPYHLALGDRSHWIKYQEGSPSHWTKASLNHFKTDLFEFFSSNKSFHTPLGRASPHASATQSQLSDVDNLSGVSNDKSRPSKPFISNQFKRLMSSCFLLTCKDVIVYKVALSKRKRTQIEMLTSDKTRLCLPDGTSFLHMEFSTFYYPGGFNFPVPSPKMYMQVSPLKLDVDLISCLWLNAFACHLKERTVKSVPNPPYIDIHTEILMPRIIMKPIMKAEKQKGRPRALQILTSRLVVSNVRPPDPTDPGSKSSLTTCLEEAQNGPLFFGSGFPSRVADRLPISPKFLHHADGSDIIPRSLECSTNDEGFAADALWTDPRDVIFCCCDPVWIEYLDRTSDTQHTPPPFVDPFPISIWIHIKELSHPSAVCSISGSSVGCSDSVMDGSLSSVSTTTYDSLSRKKEKIDVSNEASLHMLVFAPQPVNVQISHLQFVFLMRILDAVSEFTTFLNEDTISIQSRQETFLVAGIFPYINVSLIVPPSVNLTPLPNSPSEINDNLPANLSCLQPLKDLVDRVHEDPKSSPSKSSNPSLSPCDGFSPTEAGENEEGGGRLAKSLSDGCITTTVAAPIPNCLEYPESVNISKSGEGLNNLSASAIVNVPSVGSGRRAGVERKSSTSSSISSSVRRGLTSGLHSLRNTLESSVGAKMATAGDDMSDTASIHSDLSNDSDTFAMLYLENDNDNCIVSGSECAFLRGEGKIHPEGTDVETATEVGEDVLSSSEPSEASTATKLKQNVGAVTFKIGNGQFVLESEGHNSFIKFQSTSLGLEEWTRISKEEFQNKFRSKNNEGLRDSSMKPCSIKARLNTEGFIKLTDSSSYDRDQEVPCYLENRYTCSLPVHRNSNLEADVTGLSMSIFMSSLMEILDLIEDEIVPIPLPMKIKLEKLDIEIVDSRSKLAINSQKFYIPRLLVDRDETCCFTILPVPTKESTPNVTSCSSSSSIYPTPSVIPTQAPDAPDTPSAREEDLRKELDRVKEQLASCQRENLNLMKALKILHEDRNIRK